MANHTKPAINFRIFAWLVNVKSMENMVISGELLEKINLSPADLLVDLACYLYDKGRLSFGQARSLAQIDVISFQKALQARQIYLKYSEEELQTDLKNWGYADCE